MLKFEKPGVRIELATVATCMSVRGAYGTGDAIAHKYGTAEMQLPLSLICALRSAVLCDALDPV